MHGQADGDALREGREALERVSEPFARRRMERALNAGMSGKTLHEIEGALDDDEATRERRGGHAAETMGGEP